MVISTLQLNQLFAAVTSWQVSLYFSNNHSSSNCLYSAKRSNTYETK